jgi:hypothetical protein
MRVLDRLACLLLVIALTAAWWDWREREERRASVEAARLMAEVHAIDTASTLAGLFVGRD